MGYFIGSAVATIRGFPFRGTARKGLALLAANTLGKMETTRPISDMPKFRELFKKAKHVVVLTGECQSRLSCPGLGYLLALDLQLHTVSYALRPFGTYPKAKWGFCPTPI